MNKWKIDCLMKNGELVLGIYVGPETKVEDVATLCLKGHMNSFVPLIGKTSKHMLYIRIGDISAAEISVYDGPWPIM